MLQKLASLDVQYLQQYVYTSLFIWKTTWGKCTSRPTGEWTLEQGSKLDYLKPPVPPDKLLEISEHRKHLCNTVIILILIIMIIFHSFYIALFSALE